MDYITTSRVQELLMSRQQHPEMVIASPIFSQSSQGLCEKVIYVRVEGSIPVLDIGLARSFPVLDIS